MVAKPKATRKNNVVIVDPKVKRELEKNMKKNVKSSTPEPKRRIVTRKGSDTTLPIIGKTEIKPKKVN